MTEQQNNILLHLSNMEIIKTKEFERSFEKLPKEIQELFLKQEQRFRENWRDPRLHIKKVRFLGFALSFRITRRYRALFYLQNPQRAVFFDIDHRKDVYRL